MIFFQCNKGQNNTSSDVCRGSPGGPVMTEDHQGTMYQFGIVSFFGHCDSEKYPNVTIINTYVYSYIDWIQETIAKFQSNNFAKFS